MSALAVLVRAALIRHLRANLLCGLVIALATAGLASALIVRADAGARVDGAFDTADGAQVALWVRPDAADRAIVALRASGAARVSAPARTLDASLAIGRERAAVEVREVVSGESFNAPHLAAGRLPAEVGEVLLDASVAHGHGFGAGDTIRVGVDGTTTRWS